MNKENKLKPKNILKTVILINLSIFILLGISLIIRFYYGSDIIFFSGALFAFIAVICNLFLLFRTRNIHFFIPVFMFVFYFIANIFKVFYSESTAEYFLFILFLFAIWFFYILVKKKIKSRYREVLEMAANPIDESLDGFTARPYSAGKSNYSFIELKYFSKYLIKNQIAIPYFEKDRLVLLLEYSFWHLSYIKNNYEKLTHVIIKKDGEIIVMISKSTYQKYKDELTFDKLCASFGDLFKEFFNLIKTGREIEIIKRMNALREKR